MKKIILMLLLVTGFTFYFYGSKVMAADKDDNILIMKLKDGEVKIKMRPDVAPKHVARIKELAAEKFYDGVKFHRVIDGFMAQTGDPTGTGMGGSGKKLAAEFNNVSHERGTVSMARAQDPNSADSQFSFALMMQVLRWRNIHLGEVIQDGICDKIKKGDPADMVG